MPNTEGFIGYYDTASECDTRWPTAEPCGSENKCRSRRKGSLLTAESGEESGKGIPCTVEEGKHLGAPITAQ